MLVVEILNNGLWSLLGWFSLKTSCKSILIWCLRNNLMNRSMFWDDNIDIEGFIFSSAHGKRMAIVLLGAICMECFQWRESC
jgi:hypothetical protein